MGQTGKFIFKKFAGKTIEIYTDLDSEWISYAEANIYNRFTIIGMVSDYDDETGVLELKNTRGQVFYLNSDDIQLFWLYGTGFDLLHNLNKMIDSGYNFSFDKNKHKEIVDSKFNQHLAALKKPKV